MTESSKTRSALPPPLTPAQGFSKLAPLAYTLALVVVALDQVSKAWILDRLRLPERFQVPVFPPVFKLTMVWNRGVSYGFLNGSGEVGRWGLALFSAAIAVAIAVWARRVERRLPALALGLVMGGAVGNLIDRVRIGAVVDFLDFSGLHFPWVFNVADSAISVGVALLLLDSVLAPKPARPGAAPPR